MEYVIFFYGERGNLRKVTPRRLVNEKEIEQLSEILGGDILSDKEFDCDEVEAKAREACRKEEIYYTRNLLKWLYKFSAELKYLKCDKLKFCHITKDEHIQNIVERYATREYFVNYDGNSLIYLNLNNDCDDLSIPQI